MRVLTSHYLPRYNWSIYLSLSSFLFLFLFLYPGAFFHLKLSLIFSNQNLSLSTTVSVSLNFVLGPLHFPLSPLFSPPPLSLNRTKCAQCCFQYLQFITLSTRSMGLLMSLRLKSTANKRTIRADRLTLNASQDGWHTLKIDQYITIKIIQKHPSSCLAFVRIHYSQSLVYEDW